MLKYSKKIFLSIIVNFIFSAQLYAEDLISLFPIEHYDQNVSTWIKPTDSDFDKEMMTQAVQKKHMERLYEHYVGSLSPWDAGYISQILRQAAPNDLVSMERKIIANFTNEGQPAEKIGYAENFRPYKKDWIERITYSMNVDQFSGKSYYADYRGIAVDNLHARALPTDDVYFYSHKLAGEGYPFDNLQVSALWIGTPVYILGQTRDRAWMLVVTPDFIGWVKSSGIARVDNQFVDQWTKAAKWKLAAITKTQTSLISNFGYLGTAYIGSYFPATEGSAGPHLSIPVKTFNNLATIKTVYVSHEEAGFMPLPSTPHTFSTIINSMIERPYGWGSMYFYNDCSAELKSLLTPFGIWIPRHSSDQVTVTKMVDMSSATLEKRLNYLMENGQRFMNIIYIGGHVMLYVGKYSENENTFPLTYQNMWGLSPTPANRRAVIGESVLFPLLKQYPEDPSLNSPANKKLFQVAFLNELNDLALEKAKPINMKSLIYPENLYTQ